MIVLPLLFADDAVAWNPLWINVVGVALLIASMGVIVAWRRSYALGREFIGPRDVRSEHVRPWGQVVAFGFLSMLLAGVVIFLFKSEELQQLPADLAAPERLAFQLSMVRWGVAGNLVTLGLVLLFSYWQVKISDGEVLPWLGLIPNRRDWRNGLLVGVACVPLLLLLQGLLQHLSQQFFQEQAEHPYIEMIRKNKDLDREMLFELLGWITVSVTLIAPLLEELLFRGLLQGWLRGRYRRMTDKMLSGAAGGDVPVGPATDNPYAAPQVRVTLAPVELQRQRLITWGPIMISSFAFSFAHFGHGPAPIPLFVFSAVLGYLYEKTGRLAPSIIAHCMLNLCTSILLWVAILYRLPWD